jgi:hypothetical protein
MKLLSISPSLLLAGLVFAANLQASPPRAEAGFTAQPPDVDGKLDDTAWKAAQPIVFPADDARTSEARFLWTKEGVYVAFRTEDPTPAYGHAAPGQPMHQGDTFEIFVDESGDHRQWYEIQADPAGQVYIKNYLTTAEPRLTAEGRLTPEFCESEYWRYDWPVPEKLRIASRRDTETGLWTLEMFLPASLVNRRHGGTSLTPRTWRLQLVRHDWDKPLDTPGRKCLFQYWAPILEGHPHMSPTLMGYLELLPAQP